MDIKWSLAQKDAIDSRGCNLLVSAAAGSGKTAVLAQRLVTELADRESPLDIENVLVVTFTRAAATQMRERIEKGLDSLLEKDPGNRYLRHQKLMLSAAHISTIHSLCSDLIKEHFDVIDLDPSYRMGDENELDLIKSDVVKDVMEVYYSSGNAAFSRFISAYSSKRSDRAVSEWILRCYDMSMSCPSPQYWLDSCLKWYEIPEEGMKAHVMVKKAVDDAHQAFAKADDMLYEALEICSMPDGPSAYEPAISQAREMLSALLDEDDYEKLSSAVSGISFPKLSGKRQKDVSVENKDAVKNLYKDARDAVKALSSGPFSRSLDELGRELTYMAPYVGMLIELVRTFSERYRQEKLDRNVLDFSDLEHYALKLLAEFYTDEDGELAWKSTAAADELSARFQEVICDEYQDSNRVQETILEALSGSRFGRYDRFMVGDVKQSIYRFRLADAGIFLDKYNNYPLMEHCRRIDLNENFRSRGYILECVNSIFRRIMRPEAGGIDYDENAALKAGASFPEGGGNIPDCTDVMLIDKKDSENIDDTADDAELEAAVIADEIRRITDPVSGLDVRDKDGEHYRKAGFSDIVILLRSVKGHADAMVNVLTARGIPAAAQLSVGFFGSPEIMTMTSLLDIIDNPRQDIPLAAVLRSPVTGMTNDELAMLRSYDRDAGLYECLLNCPKDKPERKKADEFLSMLEKLRDASEYMQVDELIEYAFSLTGYYDYASVMPAGSRRKANLDMLLEKARAFMATGMSGLFNFMRYIQQIKENRIDFGEASVSGADEGHVSIVSIHKSKGLEYPVVFLAGLGRQMNKTDARAALAVHPVYGIGLNAVNPVSRHKMKTMYRQFMSSVIQEEMAAEELRVLYVAMTRAMEKLYFVGTAGDVQKSLENWSKRAMDDTGRMKRHDITGAGSFLDLIMPCLFDNGATSEIERLYNIHNTGRHEDGAGALFRVRAVTASGIAVNELEHEARLKGLRESLLRAGRNEQSTGDMSDGLYGNSEMNPPSGEESGDCRNGRETETAQSALDNDLAWEYIWKDELGIKGKYSVSELKTGTAADEESEYMFTAPHDEQEYIPVFMRDEKTEKKKPRAKNGSVRGTAYHRVMQLIMPLKENGEAADITGIKEQMDVMVSAGRLDRDMSALVKAGDIEAFLNSGLGRRFAAAWKRGLLHRETQFVMGVPAGMIRKELNSEELLVVQGVIDAWFEEDGSIVLLDYKTDYVPYEGGADILRSRYETQLAYYRYALEKSSGKKVTESYIYSFRLKEVIRCET